MVFPQCVPVLAKDPLIGDSEEVYFGPPVERLMDYCKRLNDLVVWLAKPDDNNADISPLDVLCSVEVDGRRISLLARRLIEEQWKP